MQTFIAEHQSAISDLQKFAQQSELKMGKIEETINVMKKKLDFLTFKNSDLESRMRRQNLRMIGEMMNSTNKSVKVKIEERSQEQCETHLAKEMSTIQTKLTSGRYREPGGFQKLKKDLDNALNEYKEKTKNHTKGCAGFTLFQETPRLDQVQKLESNMTEHISALEEELSRLQREKEKMEQKRKTFEECRNISGQDCLMSVTRDPDANRQKMEKPLQLVCNKDGKLQLNPEALKVLQSIEDPMVVVAMVGAARTGKSYLMNCLAGDKNGFSVDLTVQSHTKGIWMWCGSLPQRPNEVLLLLDIEGLEDPEKGDSQNDNSIYSLAILLSSVFIYNGQRKIDQQSLQDLHFVTELSKWIQMKSQSDACDSWDFVRFFPEFVWVIRDLTLDMNINGKDVTPNEYLEHSLKLKDSEISEQDKKYNELRRCIRNHFPSRCCFAFPISTFQKKPKQLQELEDKDLDEDFVTERQKLINYIQTHKKFKSVVGGLLVTGRRFVELTKAYVGMMADGVLPCVESCVAELVEVENQAAVDEAQKFFDGEMRIISKSDNVTMNKLIDYYYRKSKAAFSIFHKRCINNSGKHFKQLEEIMSLTYKSLVAKIKEKSQEECETHLKVVMSSIKENLTSEHYLSPGGFQALKKDLDKAVKEYKEKTKDEMELWKRSSQGRNVRGRRWSRRGKNLRNPRKRRS
ncbi:guanylate-binding protein 1-like isoform X2 [Mobula hypostoma]|uniref:guanylate-binding protein 1-like isoform X2 n=1 Tax=Mobula hypostoma TaxID=723540 RepID=UPI002FC29E73